MTWRLAKSLDTLRAQINTLAPKRSKASDGTIGDAKHAKRKSDHNPDADGTVDAIDLTHDPKGGLDIARLVDVLIRGKDRRIAYLIANGQIISGAGGPRPWVKRAYTGSNKHTKHIHISVLDKFQDDTAAWNLAGLKADAKPAPKPAKPAPPKPAPDEVYASKAMITVVQERLTELGYPLGAVDGVIGALTRSSIRDFRADNGLPEGETIDAGLVAALDSADQRKLDPKREAAPIEKVAEKAPETAANWRTEVAAKYGSVGLIFLTIVDWLSKQFQAGQDAVQPILDLALRVPSWVWIGLAAAVLLALWWNHRKGRMAGVDAFRAGARL